MARIRTVEGTRGRKFVIGNGRVTIFGQGPPISMKYEIALKHADLPDHVRREVERAGTKAADKIAD